MDYYVIYKHPADYPNEYVVRLHRITEAGVQYGIPQLSLSIRGAREYIPAGLTCIKRHKDDDPVIVETWI